MTTVPPPTFHFPVSPVTGPLAVLPFIPPFTVFARTGPVAFRTITPPFTVVARTSAPTSRTETPPFTERAPTFTDLGTLTVILTFEWFSLLRLLWNDSTSPSSQRELLFQIAQIVTLPPDWTTS